MRSMDLVENILVVSLLVALLCSCIIFYQVFVLKHDKYSKCFSAWQMPMIFAVLADLYFFKIKK